MYGVGVSTNNEMFKPIIMQFGQIISNLKRKT